MLCLLWASEKLRSARSRGWLGCMRSLLFVGLAVFLGFCNVVGVQRVLKVGVCALLELVCFLQLFDPLSFLGLKSCHLLLDLNASFIFFVNLSYQIEALLLAFECFLLLPQIHLLLLLSFDHCFHSMCPHLLCLLLHFNHLFVLPTLFLQPRGFILVNSLFCLCRLCERIFPHQLFLHVLLERLLFFKFRLILVLFFFHFHLCVALPNGYNVFSLFPRLLDLLPSLHKSQSRSPNLPSSLPS